MRHGACNYEQGTLNALLLLIILRKSGGGNSLESHTKHMSRLGKIIFFFFL